MKRIIAVLLLLSSSAFAQTFTTGELVDPAKWSNVIPMTGAEISAVEGYGGGPVPAFNTDTNSIRFSYEPYTVGQLIGINSVLQGQGIQVTGYNYSWKIYNDLTNYSNTRGSLFARVFLMGTQDILLDQYFYDYSNTDTGASFIKFKGTQNFTNNYSLSSIDYLGIEFTGSDMNYWSGYYGPRVRDASLTLNYTVTSSLPTTKTTEPIVQTTGEETSITTPIQQEIAVDDTADKSSETKSISSATVNSDAKHIIIEGTKNTPRIESVMVESAIKENIIKDTISVSDNLADTTLNSTSNFSESRITTNIDSESSLVAITQHSFSMNPAEDINPTSVRNLSLLSSSKLVQDREQNTVEQKSSAPAELSSIASSGTQIASLQVVPNGFDNYLTMVIVDQKFYEQKTIYKNQRVIDNLNASRGLNANNKYDQMINDQYKEK